MFAISKLVDWVGGYQTDNNALPDIACPQTGLADEVKKIIEYEEPDEYCTLYFTNFLHSN